MMLQYNKPSLFHISLSSKSTSGLRPTNTFSKKSEFLFPSPFQEKAHPYHTTSPLYTTGLQWFAPNKDLEPPLFSSSPQEPKAACFLRESTDLVSPCGHESALQSNDIPATKPNT